MFKAHWTALHYACAAGNFINAEKLVLAGADRTIADVVGAIQHVLVEYVEVRIKNLEGIFGSEWSLICNGVTELFAGVRKPDRIIAEVRTEPLR